MDARTPLTAGPERPVSQVPVPALSPAPDVGRVLHDDPAGVYGRMDARTREWYCRVVADWSAESGLSGAEVAKRANARAAAAQGARDGGNPAAGHVGYHLVGPGAEALRSALGGPRSWRGRLARGVRRHLAGWYLGLVTAVVVAQLAGVAAYASSAGAGLFLVLASAVLGLPVFCANAKMLAKIPFRSRVPRRVLPKMEFGGGIPDEHRTLVAVPSLVGSAERGKRLVERLERLAAANDDRNLGFVLLTDFRDSDSQWTSRDEEIVSALEEAVSALNRKHGDGSGDRFFVLHRERRWNASEGVWMGWERKRGKILELNRLLTRRDADTSFRWTFGDLAGACAAAPFRYVIVLDDDNGMEEGQAHALVRTAAHPLNVPWLGATGERVVEGYAVVQPVLCALPPAVSTVFGTLVDPRPPLRPLQSRPPARNFQFDLTGTTRYAGKGLYHVGAFAEVLDRSLPENLVLNHDQVEGYYARTGFAGDVFVTQGSAGQYCSRSLQRHRWIRGYWQLTPWILRKHVRDARGERRRNPIGFLDRCAILGQLGGPMIPLGIVSLLVLGWAVLPGNPVAWTLLAWSPFAMVACFLLLGTALSWILGPRHRAAPPDGKVPAHRRLGFAGAQVGRIVAGVAYNTMILAYGAVLTGDAVVRAIYRMTISHRKLLQWTAQHEVEAGAAGSAPRHLRGLWVSPLVAAAVLGILVAADRESLPLALPFLLLWAVAPWVVAAMDRPRGAGAGR